MATALNERTEYDRIPWAEFLRRLRWNQAEHVLVIAPTGQGKTTLMAQLTPMRRHNLILGTKTKDKTYNDFLKQGFKRIEDVSEIRHWDQNVLLWPSFRGNITEYQNRQRRAFQRAFNYAASTGGWTLWNDEELYMCTDLGLEREVKYFLFQARAAHLTIVNGTQRPANIPLGSYSGATHAFLWGTNIDADEKRLRDLGMVDPGELMHNLRKLKRFEFVYLNTRTASPPIISKVEHGKEGNESAHSHERARRNRSLSDRIRALGHRKPTGNEVRRQG